MGTIAHVGDSGDGGTGVVKAKRRLTPEEERLWQQVARTVSPLDGGRALATEATAPSAVSSAPANAARPEPTRLPPPTPAGLDRRTAQRLRRGRLPIDRRFDLHGHTQASGHAALLAFVVRARADGCRQVLVVTGRGRDGGGVLKRTVPRWLAEPAFHRHVHAFQEAGPRHGGAGALYLILRRRG